MTMETTDKTMKSRGFTLIELLAVMMIIAILAAISLGVQRASIVSARKSRTRATIMKIDTVVSSLYEKYQYRKVNVDDVLNSKSINLDLVIDDAIRDDRLNGWTGYSFTNETGRVKAQYMLRTMVLRDLLRMDMPINRVEATVAPLAFASSVLTTDERLVVRDSERNRFRSGLNSSYQQLCYEYEVNPAASERFEPPQMVNAELLYLIVTNGDPETRATFSDREIGDTNGNGFNEFLDGWGNPIFFLRWAPGLTNSSRQPSPDQLDHFFTWRTALAGYEVLPERADTSFYRDYMSNYEKCSAFMDQYADPLNPMGLCSDQNIVARDWLLVPLIYSCGPDSMSGLNTNIPSDASIEFCNPYGEGYKNVGASDELFLDNITNHNYYNE